MWGIKMKQIKNLTFEKRENTIMTELSGSPSVSEVKIKLSQTGVGRILVKYAQNSVLSDLIEYGWTEIGNNWEHIFRKDPAVSASHLFIELPSNEIEVESIRVFEETEEEGGELYPAYFDTELDENYYLDTVSVCVPSEGFSHYSIYTSLDGVNFDLLAKKRDNRPCDDKNGDVYNAEGKEARIIRVYVEYNSEGAYAKLNDVKFSGRKSGNPVKEYKEVEVPDFVGSKYDVEVSKEDTYDEVYGIIERRVGKEYCSWFELIVEDNPRKGHDYDYFELSQAGDKIHIKANNGVSLASGLNHYLKYFCKVNISQVGDRVDMPKTVVPIETPVFKETKAKVRYAYNYCTFSYSMPFWGEKEWRDELDWLALNGVNLILDLTGQEEVWRRFLKKLGYSHSEIKKYIAGPAYYAWAYMANIYGFGGPIHDSWFEERTDLARRNHLIMRKLGMYPILQGYSGMVPIDVQNYDPKAEIIPQGKWGMFNRPYMLKTTSDVFKEYAEMFYGVQREVYGAYSKYYATDPFHEGGVVGDMSPRDIAKEVLTAMIKGDSDAVWVIQSWQNNPTSELLRGIAEVDPEKEHEIVLDLYAEKQSNYDDGAEGNPAHGYSVEFDSTPWVFCMLNNFGGRLGMHGHLDNLISRIPKAFNTCNKIAGIGITPEASVNNPVLYEFLFDSIWQDDASQNMKEVEISDWLDEYCARRYGKDCESARKAWNILIDTVYKAELNNIGQGAPESVLNARPSLSVRAASTWGNAIISYDKGKFEEAARLFFEDFEKLSGSEGYKYDLITIVQQVLSNRGQDYYNEMVKRFKEKDIEGFEVYSDKVLNTADKMESVLGCSEYYLLGRWVEQAKALAKNADDFSKMIYEFNARCLITTWGAYNQGVLGTIFDYSNRQWSGMISDFYKPRWVRFIDNCKAELSGRPYDDEINYFEWEWNWIRDNNLYTTEARELDAETVRNILFE